MCRVDKESYVISNHMSFCYIDDSGNQMFFRVIAQPVLSDYSDVAERETRQAIAGFHLSCDQT